MKHSGADLFYMTAAALQGLLANTSPPSNTAAGARYDGLLAQRAVEIAVAALDAIQEYKDRA